MISLILEPLVEVSTAYSAVTRSPIMVDLGPRMLAASSFKCKVQWIGLTPNAETRPFVWSYHISIGHGPKLT
jgi:hypothetical protein